MPGAAPTNCSPAFRSARRPTSSAPTARNWGITGFSPAALRRTGFDPFIATLRAGLDHAGGIRIDHALGLSRLWVVPQGETADEGAYLTFPLEDMLRILAIESHRARAIVIGEDLGTVPAGLRERMEARAVLGMRVLWFERDEEGAFTPPAEWDAQSAAMTGTMTCPQWRAGGADATSTGPGGWVAVPALWTRRPIAPSATVIAH